VSPQLCDTRRLEDISFNAELVELEKVELKNPVLVQGLPGLGYVGKVTVDYLIEKLDTVKIAELYSRFLTLADGNLGITVEIDGTYTMPKYQFHAYTGSAPNLILLTGDTQPQYWGQFEIANTVLDYLQSMGGDTVVAIGGYGTQVRRQLNLTYVIVSDDSMVEQMRKLGVEVARSGTIRGAFGVLLGLAQTRQMRCIGLLGATRGLYPDVDAARRIVRILMKMYDLSLDTTDLDVRVRDLRQKMRRLRELQKEIMRPVRPEGSRKEPPSGYII